MKFSVWISPESWVSTGGYLCKSKKIIKGRNGTAIAIYRAPVMYQGLKGAWASESRTKYQPPARVQPKSLAPAGRQGKREPEGSGSTTREASDSRHSATEWRFTFWAERSVELGCLILPLASPHGEEYYQVCRSKRLMPAPGATGKSELAAEQGNFARVNAASSGAGGEFSPSGKASLNGSCAALCSMPPLWNAFPEVPCACRAVSAQAAGIL